MAYLSRPTMLIGQTSFTHLLSPLLCLLPLPKSLKHNTLDSNLHSMPGAWKWQKVQWTPLIKDQHHMASNCWHLA
jgi:hypothetical protein